MKKILSYLWPQTTKFPSDHNGNLEVTLYNGKKMLDSKNANYSFGSLQRILEIGFNNIDFTNINSILLLGLGGGSAVNSLRKKFKYNKLIHAVELDSKVINIAEKEFGVASSDNLIIQKADALDFVANCKKEFDLVIVDIFIDNRVPNQFYSTKFCENVLKLISSKGNLIFNLGLDKKSINERKKVAIYFKEKQNIHVNLLEKVMGTNDLLILKTKT